MRYFLLLFIFYSALASAQKTILHCGQLIDVKAGTIQKEMSIIVEGNKIVDVQKGYTVADSNSTIIDLKNRTVMPGLIDMHATSKKKQIQTGICKHSL
jgi:imidazolonepropionase-like amidohydrolase